MKFVYLDYLAFEARNMPISMNYLFTNIFHFINNFHESSQRFRCYCVRTIKKQEHRCRVETESALYGLLVLLRKENNEVLETRIINSFILSRLVSVVNKTHNSRLLRTWRRTESLSCVPSLYKLITTVKLGGEHRYF